MISDVKERRLERHKSLANLIAAAQRGLERAQNAIGVTVSMDGPKEMQDKFRVFSNGRGSYDIIKPKVQNLLAKHRTRPIAARVTMTSGAMNVDKIYRHLKEELGFYEVGFAPVTTSPKAWRWFR